MFRLFVMLVAAAVIGFGTVPALANSYERITEVDTVGWFWGCWYTETQSGYRVRNCY